MIFSGKQIFEYDASGKRRVIFLYNRLYQQKAVCWPSTNILKIQFKVWFIYRCFEDDLDEFLSKIFYFIKSKFVAVDFRSMDYRIGCDSYLNFDY